MHFVTSTTPIDDIDGKSHKKEMKSTYKAKIPPLVIYDLGGVHTHTYTHIHPCPQESDFKSTPARPWFKNTPTHVHL